MFLFLNWFHSAPSLLLCLYICIKWLHVMWAHMWQGNHIWMSEDFFWDLIFSLHDSFQDCRTNTLPTELSCSGFQNSYLTPLMYPVFMTVSAVLFCSPFFSSSTLTCFFFFNMYREHTFFNWIRNSLTLLTWTDYECLWSFRIYIVYVFLKHWQGRAPQKDHTRLGFATNYEPFCCLRVPEALCSTQD